MISNTALFKKIFEPVFEFVQRRERINIYIFGKLFLNISTKKITNFILKFRYLRHILKLRVLSKIRKINVAFYVSEVEKWGGDLLFQKLLQNKNFKPIIYVAKQKNAQNNVNFQNIIDYCKNKNLPYELLYDIKKDKHINIKKFKADIIFYEQPWSIPKNQSVIEASKHSLVCYFPYCFHSLITNFNYFDGFHGKMWKYFVETLYHKEEYEKNFNAKNCVALGSVKLDNYKIAKKTDNQNKKKVIYAPHHSFDEEGHRCATFLENGDFILELAKKYPEIEWIIRAHPEFKNKLLKYKTKEEIDGYFKNWSEIGLISNSKDNYYELFLNSDCLITDSISFLAEYLPSKKPLLHLRNKEQKDPFNRLIEDISEGYYQINSNCELEKTFKEVVLENNDYLKEKRLEKIKYLIKDKTASENIIDFIEKRIINGL